MDVLQKKICGFVKKWMLHDGNEKDGWNKDSVLLGK